MEVAWSDIALECLAETIDYTYDTFGERQVNTMLAKIDSQFFTGEPNLWRE